MTKTLQPALDNGKPDSVSRGWRRWVRARDAAYAKPNTQAAALYRARLEAAEQFDAEKVKLRYDTRWDGKTDFYVCSDFCAVMQSQLESRRVASTTMLALGTALPTDLTRTITCHVCRRKVHRGGTTDSTHRINFRDPSQVVTDVPRRTPWHERTGTRSEHLPRHTVSESQPAGRRSAFYIFYLTPKENEALTVFLDTFRRISNS